MTPRYGTSGDGAAVSDKEEISNLPEQSLGGHNHELSLLTVKFTNSW